MELFIIVWNKDIDFDKITCTSITNWLGICDKLNNKKGV